MGTDNPKVSAYVPQVLKDRLKEFRKERNNISESQAVTLILSEYFEVDPSTKPFHNSISQRLEDLERKLAQVNELHSRLLSELEEKVEDLTRDVYRSPEVFSEPSAESDSELPLLEYLVNTNQDQSELLLQGQGKLPVIQEVEKEIVGSDDSFTSLSGLPVQQDEYHDSELTGVEEVNNSGLLSEQKEKTTVSDNVQDLNSSSLTQENIQNINRDQQENTGNGEKQVELVRSNTEEVDRPTLNLLSEPLENNSIGPVSAKLLTIRFGMAPSSIGTLKSRYSPEKFREWTIHKDPSNIPWKFGGNGKNRGYLPDGELTSEQKSELLEWLQKNSNK